MCKILEQWMQSYRPEEFFDETAGLRPNCATLRPRAIVG